MEEIKQEKTILNIIKYGPIILVLTLSFIITKVMLKDKKHNFEQELNNYQENYMIQNKIRIQEEVNEVYNYVISEKSKAEKLLKESIKNKVYDAHKIATSIYTEDSNEDGHHHSKQHILKSIKNALGAMTYNKGRGYIFIDNYNGTKLLQPFNKELEGKNLLEFEDAKGYKFVQKIVNTIKNKTEAYDSYYWYKSGDKSKSFKKISFYKYFEPLNIAIGTGEYVKDFENELKEKVLKRIQNIRYGNIGYIFIYDKKGTCLSHLNKDLIGKNRFNYQDKKGRYLVQEIINLGLEKKSGFLSYNLAIKPTENIVNYSKISFLKLFDEWGWVIGTDFYTDTLRQDIEKKQELLSESNTDSVEAIVVISILITILFIILSFIISKFIEKRFQEYKKNIEQELAKSLEKEQLLLQQSKMAAMGEMIENIAHQWRQPLSAISVVSSGIKVKHELCMLNDKEIEVGMDQITNAVDHLSQTIDDFRDFYKIDKEKESFNIKEVFDKAFRLITSQFKSTNITILKESEEGIFTGHKNELIQVLINILNNARDELINKEQHLKLIFIKTIVNNDILEIYIKDNAGGIPKDIIKDIFKSHFTTKQDSGGTGIGLYMSKMILEKHLNGTIEASNIEFIYEDNSYNGAQFKISLPMSNENKKG